MQPVYEVSECGLFCKLDIDFVYSMQVRNWFPSVCFSNAAILQSQRSWVRAIVESYLYLVAMQDIIAIFAGTRVDQLSDEDPIRAVLRLDPQNGTRRGRIDLYYDVLE